MSGLPLYRSRLYRSRPVRAGARLLRRTLLVSSFCLLSITWAFSYGLCFAQSPASSPASSPSEEAVPPHAGPPHAGSSEGGTNSPLATAYTCTSELGKSEVVGLLDKVQDSYRTIKALRAKFIQESSMVALDQTEESSGEVSFLKPGQMKWEYSYPELQTFLVKDTTVWFYQAALKQVVVDDISRVLLSDLPVSFLMGIGQLGRDFSLTHACRAGARILLELAPRSAKVSNITSGSGAESGSGSQLGKFRLLVDGVKLSPLGAEVSDLGGNTTTILFSDLRINPPAVVAADFSPNFPLGIDVSDRRAVLDARRVSGEGVLERELGLSTSPARGEK
jgi:outer membrane lipoprotein-sorting protein